MSETSISLSPSISENTINKRRLRRRNKRSKVDLSTQFNTEQEENTDIYHSLLNSLYNDPEYEPAQIAVPENNTKALIENPAILSNFKPFELEKSLAAADHIFVQQSCQNKTLSFPQTQGFVTCIKLSQTNNKPQCCVANKTEAKSENDSFIITETELLSCCHHAEKILQNNESNQQDSTLHELTPNKKDDMLLVNSILEDFSQSPLHKEQIIKNVCWQYTPEFRLRRLPIKSYSRKHMKCTRTNLAQRFTETKSRQSSEYDEDLSCSSSLSVQEDDTFCENANSDSIATTLNNTERLCENLLNLSKYFTQSELMQSVENIQQSVNLINLSEDFTQNELKQTFEADQQAKDNLHFSEESSIVSNPRNISNLLSSIIGLRSKYSNDIHDDSYNSSDDFLGFENDPDLNHCDVRHSIVLKEKKDTFFDDWNDDNYHDIFACINTENILPNYDINNVPLDDATSTCTANDQTFVVPKPSISNAAFDNLDNFNTASLKPLQASEEAKRFSTKISNIPAIPDSTENEHVLNCDNKTLTKDENVFEIPEDYEWNDDCDLFLNFQTPISSKESVHINIQKNIPILPETSQHKQDAPSTSTLATLGFTTAAGKKVRITEKGQATIQRLLSDFAREINNNTNYEEELKEIKSKVYAKNHNIKINSPSFKNVLSKDETFQMATGVHFSMSTEQSLKNFKNAFDEECFGATINNKSNEVSSETHKRTDNILDEFVNIPSEDFLTDIECIENDLNTKRVQKSNTNTINMKTEDLNVGFQTANGKQVAISRKAKQIVEQLLKEFNTDVDIEKDLNDIKTKVQIKNKSLKSKPNHYTRSDEDCMEHLLFEQHNMQNTQLNANMNNGFHTANGKEICVSTKAKEKVECLLKEFNNDINIETYENDLQDLKAKVYNKNKAIRANLLSLEVEKDTVLEKFSENAGFNNRGNQLDEVSVKCSLYVKGRVTPNHFNINMDVGFQTANGKQVSVSEKAKQAVVNIFNNINTDVDANDSENYLKDIKTNEEDVKLDNNCAVELTNYKRSISVDTSDIETPCKTPAVKMFKHDLRSSKSSLVEQSLKSPLASATRSIIVRKNLLSLTKKRKKRENALNKPAEEISALNKDLLNELDTCTATPTKSMEPAPVTPNLKEFLSHASLTSTPRITNKSQSESHYVEDSDLKPIIWKNDSSVCNKSQNNSPYATKLSESSTSNVSFNSSNPSAKERIGRLKMYGKAPDLAPILIETNDKTCRTSGLRRTRSMLKNLDK